MPPYMTMVLELLKDQYAALHERLRQERKLLEIVNLHAAALKRYHEIRMDRLALAKPGSEESQIASEALELGIEDLREDLRFVSQMENGDAETFSLDVAMAYLSHRMPQG
jgi:hypothetical protein